MDTEIFDLTTPDGPMRAFRADPDGPPRGGIVVIQEAFGLNTHIEDVTRRFAAAGYLAVAPELFHRSDEPGPFSYDGFAAVIPAMAALSDEQTLADVEHGFFCDLRPAFAPDAAADTWVRTLRWFQRLDAP